MAAQRVLLRPLSRLVTGTGRLPPVRRRSAAARGAHLAASIAQPQTPRAQGAAGDAMARAKWDPQGRTVARELLDRALVRGEASTELYNRALAVHKRAGDPEGAAQLVQEMQTLGLSPDAITRHVFVGAVAESGGFGRALELAAALHSRRLLAGPRTHNSILAAALRRRDYAAFDECVAHMRASGVAPSGITRTLRLRRDVEVGDPSAAVASLVPDASDHCLTERLAGLLIGPERATTGTPPSPQSAAGSVESGERWGAEEEEEELAAEEEDSPAASRRGFVAAARAAAARGDLPATFAVLRGMSGAGHRVSPTVFAIVLRLLARRGDAEAAADLWAAMRREGVPLPRSAAAAVAEMHAARGDVRAAFSALAAVSADGPCAAVVDAAVGAALRVGDGALARRALAAGCVSLGRGVRRATVERLLAFAAERGDQQLAIGGFRLLRASGQRATLRAHHAALAAMLRQPRAARQTAASLLHALAHVDGLAPNKTTHLLVAAMLSRCGDEAGARRVVGAAGDPDAAVLADALAAGPES